MNDFILQNRELILRALHISPIDCIQDNPYLQHATTKIQGCQIDYLIQTRNKNLFVCEFKFKLKEISAEIITEMKDRVSRLQIPRYQGVVPVLFHIGGVTDSVIEQDYFYRIIDLSALVSC